MNKIRLVVADDHAVVRMGLVALFEAEKDIAVVGEASDGEEAVRLVQNVSPDVVLMDLVMPRMNGIDATAAVKRHSPKTKVLILTTFGDATDIGLALEAGADGALLKNADYSEVIDGIRTIAAGGSAVSPKVRRMIAVGAPAPDLTDRQLTILGSITRGLSNADIARQLGITPHGVKFHLAQIYAKLGVATRTEATAIALRKRLIKQ